jgi:hypothetical protein
VWKSPGQGQATQVSAVICALQVVEAGDKGVLVMDDCTVTNQVTSYSSAALLCCSYQQGCEWGQCRCGKMSCVAAEGLQIRWEAPCSGFEFTTAGLAEPALVCQHLYIWCHIVIAILHRLSVQATPGLLWESKRVPEGSYGAVL